VKHFEMEIMNPLNWGLESSEDTKEKEFQLIKNEKGEYISEKEELERVKGDNIKTETVNYIYEKIC